MGKLTAEQRLREYNRGQKAARDARSRSWSEPWAYPFGSDQHYEERRDAFNESYGIIDATPMSVRRWRPRRSHHDVTDYPAQNGSTLNSSILPLRFTSSTPHSYVQPRSLSKS
jgi:hypothetical protein